MPLTSPAALLTADLQRLYCHTFETNDRQPPSLMHLIEGAPGWWFTDALAYLARQARKEHLCGQSIP